MIHFILLFSRQGKLRLQKWYEARDSKDKKKIIRELTGLILQRKQKMCNFIEYKDMCIVYKRYASLFFCFAVDKTDNELGALEVIHRYVEVLDKYFGSVCELDIIFNFEKGMWCCPTKTEKYLIIKYQKFEEINFIILFYLDFLLAYFILDELLLGGEMQESFSLL